MASIYKQRTSKKWYASIKAWDSSSQKWVRKRVTTDTEDKKQAMLIAQQLENASLLAHKSKGSNISKDRITSIVESIFTLAGCNVEGNVELPTIHDYVERWKKQQKHRVAPKSFSTYITNLNDFTNWVSGKKEHARLDWLTPARANDFYTYLLKKKSNTSANNILGLVSRIYKSANVEFELKNPLEQINRTSNKSKDRLKRLPLSSEEVNLLLNHLKIEGLDEWSIAMKLALMSGCRLSDAINMKSSHITDGVLIYTQQKTSKTIKCPLVVPAWKEEIEAIEGYLTPTLRTTDVSDLSMRFVSLISEAGIKQEYHTFKKTGVKMARKSFHSLRHTLRTAIVSSGGSDAQADLILGHSGNQGKTYTHSEMDAMRATLERVFK